jgi:hypothetical protein
VASSREPWESTSASPRGWSRERVSVCGCSALAEGRNETRVPTPHPDACPEGTRQPHGRCRAQGRCWAQQQVSGQRAESHAIRSSAARGPCEATDARSSGNGIRNADQQSTIHTTVPPNLSVKVTKQQQQQQLEVLGISKHQRIPSTLCLKAVGTGVHFLPSSMI